MSLNIMVTLMEKYNFLGIFTVGQANNCDNGDI